MAYTRTMTAAPKTAPPPSKATANANRSALSVAYHYFHALRPHKGPPLATGALVVGRVLLEGHSCVVYEPSTLIAALAVFLSYGAGMVMNDCVDYQADVKHVSKQHRPIASGRISVRAGWIYVCVLCGVSLILAQWAGGGAGSVHFVTWMAGNVSFMFLYIAGIQKLAIMKNLLCGWLAISPLIGATLMTENTSSENMDQAKKHLIWLAALALPWQTAREMLGDLDDMAIDKDKKRTIAWVIGPVWTHRIAYGVVWSVVGAGVLPYYRVEIFDSSWLYMGTLLVAIPLVIRAATLRTDEGVWLVNKVVVIMMIGSLGSLLLKGRSS